MNIRTNWLDSHPKVKSWGWFIGLWCLSLMTFSAATFMIKHFFSIIF